MLFSPELDELKAQIKNIILRESDDFFDEPEDLAVLQVTIRIACEFYDFLKRTDSAPELEEAEYIRDTIRSGMDEFFQMSQWGDILTGLELQKGFRREFPTSFPEVKASYGSVFQELLTSASSVKGLVCCCL